MTAEIISLKGEAIVPYIPDLAKLRIQIFKDYPYLYAGDLAYEQNYLKTYLSCPESVMVLALDKNKVIGASTAIPLEFETTEVQKPFLDQQIKIADVFYFGESVLLPEYRGKKIYRSFFHERETAAKKYGSRITAFCAVERSPTDSRRPKDYMALDSIWEHFGYKKHPELCAYFEWQEIGEETVSKKPLLFWLKNL